MDDGHRALPRLTNPFITIGTLSQSLTLEQCQKIHFIALRHAAHHMLEWPRWTDASTLRERAHIIGSEIYFAHPAHIEHVFRHVTLGVYQYIRELYCSRLGLSPTIIGHIMAFLAKQYQVASIDEEAVWAICAYLEKSRHEATDVTITSDPHPWFIGQIPTTLMLPANTTGAHRIMINVIVGAESELYGLVLSTDSVPPPYEALFYQALVLQRKPAPPPHAQAGLLWRIPQQLHSSECMTSDMHAACRCLNITLQQHSPLPQWITPWIERWEADFADRGMSLEAYTRVLDTYLYRAFGHSPYRRATNQALSFRKRKGYSRDPSWQLQALRFLLPCVHDTISATGTVSCQGLTYEHEMLVWWAGHEVSIRPLATAEAFAWIYLGDDVLCLAAARELRRADGSYRNHRVTYSGERRS